MQFSNIAIQLCDVSSGMCWNSYLKWRNQEASPPQGEGNAAPPL